MLEQVVARERRRELDLRFALAVVELDGDDELLARDGFGARERRAAPVRELIAAVAAGPALADAIGIREREQPARIGRVRACVVARAELAQVRAFGAAHALEHAAVAAAALQRLEPRADVAVARARRRAADRAPTTAPRASRRPPARDARAP